MDKNQNNTRKLSCRNKNNAGQSENNSKKLQIQTANNNTKPQQQLNTDFDDSLPFIPNTQELLEDVDVVWDWNSPKRSNNKTSKIFKKKQCTVQESPKQLKCTTIKRQPSNNQLQNFIKFKQELMDLRQEIAYQEENERLTFEEEDMIINDPVDLNLVFDDSLVEDELLKVVDKNNSLDDLLTSFQHEEEDDLFATINIPETKEKKAIEVCNVLSRHALDEIEKKRQQAVAKLEAKKRKDLMEKNRLEALRRLENNRKKAKLLKLVN